MRDPKELLRRARWVAIPVLIGVLAFFLITGGRILSLKNIAWLTEGDEATYFLAWNFFHHTPWGFPLGINPRYGAELSASIALVDNIPLFGFAFKAIGGWLPFACQYFGIWILCCFVAHAWFAWLLVGLQTRAPVARTAGTVLLVFAPPFLARLTGHFQMCGQWLLLAALYISFGPRHLARGAAWPVLVFVASLVHTYMTAMVLGLWLADWLRRVLFERRTWVELLQPVLIPGLVLLASWQAGLFMLGKGIVTSGFGFYRMNVTSLFDASGWSYLLKDIPQSKGEYEGFNYLGLGALLLSVAALPMLPRAWRSVREHRQYWPLLVMMLGFTLFAISNHIGFADKEFVIPLPQSVIDRANLLRGCGRMFWPVFYALTWLIIRAVARFYSGRITAILLCIAALVQVTDTSAGWWPSRRQLMVSGPSWPSPLVSPFWTEASSCYQKILLIEPTNRHYLYRVFAYFASMHGMSTDAVYLARIDVDKLKQAKRAAQNVIKRRRFEPGAMYVFDKRSAHSAHKAANPDVDLLENVDGYTVLAPGWKCRPICRTPAAANTENCSASCPNP